MKFMAGLALKLGEARGDLPGVNFLTGIPGGVGAAELTPQTSKSKF